MTTILVDALIELVVMPALRKHLPGKDLPDMAQALLPEVRRVVMGDQPSWFEVKRLTLALVDEKIRELKGSAA